jgi:hypothetical protein
LPDHLPGSARVLFQGHIPELIAVPGQDQRQKLRTLDVVLSAIEVGDAELGQLVGPGEEGFDPDLDLGDRSAVNVEDVPVVH